MLLLNDFVPTNVGANEETLTINIPTINIRGARQLSVGPHGTFNIFLITTIIIGKNQGILREVKIRFVALPFDSMTIVLLPVAELPFV